VAAMIPNAELEGEFGEAKMGLHARLMSQGMRKLVNKINRSHCTVIFINQMRNKIGIMFGDPSTTTGGNALKFYATQRIKVTKAGAEKDGEETTAIKVKVDIVKNKIAPPAKKAELNIKFGIGIDKLEELVSLAVDNDIIKKSGSWFSYGDTKLGQGREAVKILLADNEELLQEIEKLVRVNLGLE
jgi:recombination protein RecA